MSITKMNPSIESQVEVKDKHAHRLPRMLSIGIHERRYGVMNQQVVAACTQPYQCVEGWGMDRNTSQLICWISLFVEIADGKAEVSGILVAPPGIPHLFFLNHGSVSSVIEQLLNCLSTRVGAGLLFVIGYQPRWIGLFPECMSVMSAAAYYRQLQKGSYEWMFGS